MILTCRIETDAIYCRPMDRELTQRALLAIAWLAFIAVIGAADIARVGWNHG